MNGSILLERMGSEYIEGGLNSFLNPYSYFLLRKQDKINQNIDRYMVDGWLLVLLYKILFKKQIKRASFDLTSLAPVIFNKAIDHSQSLFFIGSTKRDVAKAASEIQKSFYGINIIGYSDGYFKSYTEQTLINNVLRCSPDYIICGMGSIKQENLLIKLRASGWMGTGFTCGGFFHQTAKGINYYPEWSNKYFSRWLYRIYDEPKLLKRYTFDYLRAVIYIVYDFISLRRKG